MIGILAEKPSALRNMSKAFGGNQGTYNGESYVIVAAAGHLYSLADPDKQVDTALSKQYGSWDIKYLPWNEKDFKWKYEIKKDEKGSNAFAKDTLKNIKSVLSTCSEICIATDDDPTGEGELLAWEILDQLNLSPKSWSRMYFVDESVKELQKAFINRKSIKSMDTDMDYVKGFYRSRWDYLSMQWTRIATRLGDGRSTLRQGRLKSAMVVLVGDQLKACAEYKKIPYYQNKFKDENGVIYTNPDEPIYEKKEDVPQLYHDSDVVCDGKQMKSTPPPKLLDLATLSARLVPKGYKAKAVTDTYQKMYESQVVSYPRTEDKVITPEQFNDLLPLVDKIADVVGVDKSLLTHRTPRSTHVKTGGSHGANRPGTNVPKDLASLSQYDGKSTQGLAAAIYELLAKNYLATLAEDYEYESQKGHVKDYPDFVGTAAVPKKMGWKLVYDADAEPDEDENAKGLGTHADPYVHEGFPPKPATPTMKWLMKQLEKRDVGTGATRTSTYAEVTSTNEKTHPLLKDTKGKITMTILGDMSYLMLPGTHIGSLDMTEKLFSEMRAVGEGKANPDDCLKKIQQLIIDDIKVMDENGKHMREVMKDKISVSGNLVERVPCMWNGKEVSFKREWSGHRFTDEEVEKLLAGESVQIDAVKKDTGKAFTAIGKLGIQEFNGRKFVGFTPTEMKGDKNMAQEVERFSGTWNGKEVNPKRIWSGHRFTDEECEKLLAGETISFDAKSGSGKDYVATGKLGEGEFQGHSYVGFQLDTGGKDANGKVHVPPTWCNHTFTADELQSLESGLSVTASDFVSKKGNSFSAKVKYGKNDKGYMGIIAEFL